MLLTWVWEQVSFTENRDFFIHRHTSRTRRARQRLRRTRLAVFDFSSVFYAFYSTWCHVDYNIFSQSMSCLGVGPRLFASLTCPSGTFEWRYPRQVQRRM